MNTNLIPFSYLEIEDADQLGTTIKDQLTTSHAEDPWIQDLIADLTGPLEKTQKAIGSSTKKKETNAIRAADKAVDKSYLGMRKVVFDYDLCPLEDGYAAAQVLMPIFEKNDLVLYNRGYDEQASLLTSLFGDLSAPEAKDALVKIHLPQWLEKLKSQFDTLETLRKKRTSLSATDETPTDKAAKNELIEAIKIVLEDINTLVRRNKVPGLDQTDKVIEATARRIAANVRARETRKANKRNTDTIDSDDLMAAE